MAGCKFAARIVSNHTNVVFLWVVTQPPFHMLKDHKYAIYQRVKNSNKRKIEEPVMCWFPSLRADLLTLVALFVCDYSGWGRRPQSYAVIKLPVLLRTIQGMQKMQSFIQGKSKLYLLCKYGVISLVFQKVFIKNQMGTEPGTSLTNCATGTCTYKVNLGLFSHVFFPSTAHKFKSIHSLILSSIYWP